MFRNKNVFLVFIHFNFLIFFRLMKAMSEHTRLAPNMRIERLKTFNKRLQETKESVENFKSWQFSLDQNLVELTGRVLNSEYIVFGNNKRYSFQSIYFY